MESHAIPDWLRTAPTPAAVARLGRVSSLIRAGELRTIRPRAWAVLLVVTAKTNPKMVELESATGFSRATVKRAVSELRAAGILCNRGSPLNLTG